MKPRRNNSLSWALPMAPMIDIVFQLITFFIFALNSERIALSEEILPPVLADGLEESSHGPKDRILEVNKDGALRFDGKPLTEPTSSEETTKKILASVFKAIQKEGHLVIRADQETPFELIKPALEEANKTGFNYVSLRVRRSEP